MHSYVSSILISGLGKMSLLCLVSRVVALASDIKKEGASIYCLSYLNLILERVAGKFNPSCERAIKVLCHEYVGLLLT
jgi:hypothetical protein